MRSADLMQRLCTTGTVNAGLRALKDTHRALKQRKTGFILKISKLNGFGLFGLSFMSEEIIVNQSFSWKP